MSPARTIFLTALLAVAVAVLERGLIRLVEASGAADQPGVVLVLLLSAFLGLLTAVLTRSMRLSGAIAPTALVLGWILVPAVLGAFPGQALTAFKGGMGLDAREATALVVAVIAAAVTLGVQAER
jgi:F0F1-type ATP synthase membrane subunit a